ncbi:MAG: LacI family DNA-binding transcriptional regulator [Lachnospiraceae bacterium]
MITIKEIARELGLSTTTVSNVIHGKSWEVSAATVQRVQEALDAHGYVPNIVARNLAQKESRILGVALKASPEKSGNLIQDPFFSVVIGAIEREIRQAGYYMMLYISDNTDELIRQASSWNVDGLIVVGLVDDGSRWADGRFKKPVVCIDNYSREGLKHFVNIGLDDEKGGYLATKHLTELGHRTIAFLTNTFGAVELARFRGYRQALEEAGITYREEDCLMIRSFEDEIASSLDEVCGKLRDFTAVFCVSDLFALELMAALYDRGVRVPEEISVVGFDDIAVGRVHRPALTTVYQDIEEKGAMAARTLIGMLGGEEPEIRDILLPVELKVRQSTGVPPKEE